MDKLKELLAALEANPDLFDSYTTEQVDEAKALLAEFAGAVKSGEVAADKDALAEAKDLTDKLAARAEAIAVGEAEEAAALAELEAALGITEEEVEEIVATTEGPEDEAEDEAEEEPEAVEELEPVTASARPKLGAIAKSMPKDRKPAEVEETFALIASAGPQEGKALTASAFAQMAVDRYPSLADKMQYRLASIKTEHKYSLRARDEEYNARVLAELTADAQENGNLVASGGFCAPPQVSYNFFNIASRSGILNLPTVNAPRGSVSIPVSPSLGDFLDSTAIGREWTNTNDENPTSPATKPVFRIECPEFQDCEVSAWTTILEIGNFMGRFFPEAVENATGLAMIAADRHLNQARIAFLVAAAVAGNVSDTGGGALVNLAHNLGSNGADYRETYGMAPDAVLDVVLPSWLPRAAYADSVTRDSTNGSSLNGWLGAMFAELDLRPQFVYDLDPQTNGLFEAEATVLMYAPGSAVELDAGTLDLGIVRDSTLNSTNDYQTFVEPFVGWCVPGHEIRSLTIPVCASGATGDRVTIDCPAVS